MPTSRIASSARRARAAGAGCAGRCRRGSERQTRRTRDIRGFGVIHFAAQFDRSRDCDGLLRTTDAGRSRSSRPAPGRRGGDAGRVHVDSAGQLDQHIANEPRRHPDVESQRQGAGRRRGLPADPSGATAVRAGLGHDRGPPTSGTTAVRPSRRLTATGAQTQLRIACQAQLRIAGRGANGRRTDATRHRPRSLPSVPTDHAPHRDHARAERHQQAAPRSCWCCRSATSPQRSQRLCVADQFRPPRRIKSADKANTAPPRRDQRPGA